MRISDWSSDVCSSDLLARQVVLPRGLAVDRPCLLHGMEDGLEGDSLRLHGRRVHFRLRPAGLLGHPLHWRWRRAGPGSEEHTSELQSLMRISYAVFCLKKKNKQRRWKSIR